MIKIPTITVFMFAAVQGHVHADTLIGKDKTINATEPAKNWQLFEKSTLNMDGARARNIEVTDSTLNVNSGSRVDDIRARNGSTVTINSAQVSSSLPDFGAVRLDDSSAFINNSTITSSTTVGLQAYRSTGGSTGSYAEVNNSAIRGLLGGAEATSGSELNFKQNTLVEGTGANSFGVSLQGGKATASQSTLVGGKNGVIFTSGRNDTTDGKLVLDQSTVEGRTGSAIAVNGISGRAPVVEIDVLNGSTLTGGNGNLLEVTGGGKATMNVDNSRLTGNVVVDDGSTAHLSLQNNAWLTGQLHNVASLNVGDQSYWVLTGDSKVGDLTLAGGTVKFGDAHTFYQLDLDSLAGNGTFIMNTDFAQGKTDFLNIMGEASGSHSLLLAASGSEPIRTHVVHTEGGDAQFSLIGDRVDAGTFSYGLKQEGSDWFLDPNNREISPGTRSVLALFNTAPTVWYGEMTSLRSRMGELRFEPGQAGLWIRGYGNKYNTSNHTGVGYTQNQQGFSLGADMPLEDSQWLIGAMVGHSNSDLDLKRGSSANVKSYYVGGYATWLDEESGFYFDGVAKLNRFHNESKVAMSDGTTSEGSYSNVGAGLSAEFGRNIKLDDGYFVEPYGQLSTVVIEAANYKLDNGLKAEGERTRSIMAKVGATVGRDIQLDSGSVLQPYLRAAMVHEFANNNKVAVNNNEFNNDLSGSRAEFGAGVAVKLSKNLQLHADFEHSKGKLVDQPWGANVGVRYSW